MQICNLCQKEIIKYPYIYVGMWENYRTNSVIHYHIECFQELAGEEYIKNLLIKKK
jgi:hypothetical protein